MSTSGSEYEDGGSNGEDSDTEIAYTCRLCPGSSFTAAERDVHRMEHGRTPGNRTGGSQQQTDPGSRVRVPPAPGSDSTIFVITHSRPRQTEDDDDDDDEAPPSKKRRPGPMSKTTAQPGGKRIVSRKEYREDVDKSVKFKGA